MWRGVIDELEQQQCIGEGFPIACHRHPDTINYVSKPGQLQLIAPDGRFIFLIMFLLLPSDDDQSGGCLKSCDARLICGHKCPYKAHFQLDQYESGLIYINSAIQMTLATWPWLVIRVAEGCARGATHVIRHVLSPANLAFSKFPMSNFPAAIHAHLSRGRYTTSLCVA